MLVYVAALGEASVVDERLDRQPARGDLLQEALTRRRAASDRSGATSTLTRLIVLEFAG